MKWHFSPLVSEYVETEVTQRDQFNNDDVDISETIIREAIQNSLDAAIDDPCRVKVTVRWVDRESGLSPDFFESLFDGQSCHAKSAGIDVASLDFDNPSALIIEDFGTRGLTGSVNEKDDENFSDFWRRHGKAHKSGKSRGGWGNSKIECSAVNGSQTNPRKLIGSSLHESASEPLRMKRRGDFEKLKMRYRWNWSVTSSEQLSSLIVT